MSLFSKNIELLKQQFPSFEEQILQQYVPDREVKCYATSSGHPTLMYRGKYIHSRHDPLKEAKRFVETNIESRPSQCIVVGFGLGYIPEIIAEMFPETSVFIIEPNVPLFLSCLEHRDVTDLFARSNVTLLLDTEPETVLAVLQKQLFERTKLVYPRSLYEENKDYIDRLETILQKHLSREEINSNTLARFGKVWVKNLIANLHLIAECPGIHRLSARFAGIPALVLAAGPSLDNILPILSDLKKRFLIIAVDTSMNGCVAAGVTPDFLVVVDPQYWNTRHLDSCTDVETMLVSESSTHPRVFRMLNTSSVYLCSSLFPLGQYVEEKTDRKGTLGAGGSVSTSAWDFARNLGCDPIFFAGLDLGFPKYATHYTGSYFEQRSHTVSSRLSPSETHGFSYLYNGWPFPIENNSGDSTLTDKRLILYKWWFENQMQIHRNETTFTLSKDGAAIEGMGYMPLDSLYRYPEIRRDVEKRKARLERGEDGQDRHIRYRRLQTAVETLIDELTRLSETADRALTYSMQLEEQFNRNEPVDDILLELEKIDADILSSFSKDIAGFLLNSVSRSIMTTGDGNPTHGDIIANSQELYQGLKRSVEFHRLLLLRWFDKQK